MRKNPVTWLHEHLWSALPAQVSLRQRCGAAALWGGALLLLQRAHGTWTGGFALAAVLLALALLVPVLGQHVYLNVLRVCSVLGLIVSHLVLLMAFYLLVTPLGWVLRRTGRDPLQLNRQRQSSWQPHPPRRSRRDYYRLS